MHGICCRRIVACLLVYTENIDRSFCQNVFEENTAGKEQFYDFRLVSRVGLRLNKTIRETCGVVSASGLQNIGYLFLRRISFRLRHN